MRTNAFLPAMALVAFGLGLLGAAPLAGRTPAQADSVLGRVETAPFPGSMRAKTPRRDRALRDRTLSRSLPGGLLQPGPDRPRERPDHWKDRHGKPHGRWPWRRGHPYPYAYPYAYDDDDDEPDVVILPIPLPEPREEPVAEPEPLDPRGSFARIPARGVASPREPLEIGASIGGIPVVTLDWRAHALPEPPPGQMWVRAEGQVLRIDATSREVVALAPAAAPATVTDAAPDTPARPPEDAPAADRQDGSAAPG